MKLRVGSKGTIIILMLTLISFHFLYLFELPINDNSVRYLTWIAAILGCCIYYPGVMRIRNTFPFVRNYLTYVLFSQIIICIYSIFKYQQTIIDMFMTAGVYVMLAVSCLIIINFENYGMDFLLKKVLSIQFIVIVLALIHAAVYNTTGSILLAFDMDSFLNHRLRISLGPLTGLLVCYAFYKFLNGYKRVAMLSVMAVVVISLFYMEMTRANQLAIFVTVFMMWFFYKERSRKSVLKYMAAFCLVLILYFCGVFDHFLNILSTDSSVNPRATSTLARIHAMEYFSEFTKRNPLIGMGWIRPYTDRLIRIWSGPNNTYFLDDLGFLGQFYRQGLLGAFIYIILLLRMVYILYRLRYQCDCKIFLIGIFTYICATMPSLNCFDGSRILAVPFYIAIFEYTFRKYTHHLLE